MKAPSRSVKLRPVAPKVAVVARAGMYFGAVEALLVRTWGEGNKEDEENDWNDCRVGEREKQRIREAEMLWNKKTKTRE